jgi:hypothetical protein
VGALQELVARRVLPPQGVRPMAGRRCLGVAQMFLLPGVAPELRLELKLLERQLGPPEQRGGRLAALDEWASAQGCLPVAHSERVLPPLAPLVQAPY